MSEKISTVVLGGTGYVGGELLRLIAGHPHLELAAAVSASRAGEPVADVFPHLAPVFGDTPYAAHGGWLESLDAGSRLALFSAAPHGASAAMIAKTLEGAANRNLDVHVVDASADFRYREQADYERVYAVDHGAPGLLGEFSCGVPEHVEFDVNSGMNSGNAAHVGHPGCFATAVLLALVPLLRSNLTDPEIFVTGITGSTGSGRSPQAGTHHPDRHANLYAYKPLSHRHAPEITRLAAAASGREPKVHFVPHSGPFARGIYATVQARSANTVSRDQLRDAYDAAYGNAPFVRIVDGMPKLKNVVASNYCEIGFSADNDAVVVTSAIDNLVKGAAGGAVQWMNRLWKLPETAGLVSVAPAWT